MATKVHACSNCNALMDDDSALQSAYLLEALDLDHLTEFKNAFKHKHGRDFVTDRDIVCIPCFCRMYVEYLDL